MNEKNLVTVLGIDPGTNHCGYCLMKGIPGQLNSLVIVDIGVYSPKAKTHIEKLKLLYEFFKNYLRTHQPDQVILETVFLGKNVQSMLKLGRLQGMLFSLCIDHNIPILMHTPREIKQAITGKGGASKQQVAFMIKQIFEIKTALKLDATDAAATSLSYFLNQQQLKVKTHPSGWEKFIQENKDRTL